MLLVVLRLRHLLEFLLASLILIWGHLLHLLRLVGSCCASVFSFKSFCAQCLLDVLFKLFIFLSTHLIDFLFSKLTESSEQFLGSLCLHLCLFRECSFNDLLPKAFHTRTASLPSALWLINPSQTVLASPNVQGIGRICLDVRGGLSRKEVRQKELTVQLRWQFLLD